MSALLGYINVTPEVLGWTCLVLILCWIGDWVRWHVE